MAFSGPYIDQLFVISITFDVFVRGKELNWRCRCNAPSVLVIVGRRYFVFFVVPRAIEPIASGNKMSEFCFDIQIQLDFFSIFLQTDSDSDSRWIELIRISLQCIYWIHSEQIQCSPCVAKVEPFIRVNRTPSLAIPTNVITKIDYSISIITIPTKRTVNE